MKPRDFLTFLCLILLGFFLLSPTWNYQPLVSMGDHGRDLYAFDRATQGGVPYRDYWWVYGPLMPSWYGQFYQWFGPSIQSALTGQVALNLLGGIFVFLALRLFISPGMALGGAAWLWMFRPRFFFTYNHDGGVILLTFITWQIFSYIKNRKEIHLFTALLGAILLAFVKINFGLAALIFVLGFVWLHDRLLQLPPSRKKVWFYISSVCLAPVVIFSVYFFLANGLTVPELRQCFPYLAEDHPYHAPVWWTVGVLIKSIAHNVTFNWPNRFFAILLIGAIARTLYVILKKQMDPTQRHQLISAIAFCAGLYLINLHEYLVSGVIYRSYWAAPFTTLMIFLFLGTSLRGMNRITHLLLLGTILIIVFLKFDEQIRIVRQKDYEGQFIALERGRVLTGNAPWWVDTVEQTTKFLQSRLADDETFLALPYDPIYYFLTDRASPTRQLIFFEHINIPPEQEEKVIREMEATHVNYVLLSSRMRSGEPGLGTLGQTYCPILWKYIEKNFEPVATFGDWQNHPGWAWNHGTQILKRK